MLHGQSKCYCATSRCRRGSGRRRSPRGTQLLLKAFDRLPDLTIAPLLFRIRAGRGRLSPRRGLRDDRFQSREVCRPQRPCSRTATFGATPVRLPVRLGDRVDRPAGGDPDREMIVDPPRAAGVGPAGGRLADNRRPVAVPKRNLRHLRLALSRLIVWPYTNEAAEHFGRVFADLRCMGRPMQQTDIMDRGHRSCRRAEAYTASRAERPKPSARPPRRGRERRHKSLMQKKKTRPPTRDVGIRSKSFPP